MKWFFTLIIICISVTSAFAQTEDLPNLKQLDFDRNFSYKTRPKTEWRECKSDNECELFRYGCFDTIAILKKYRDDVEERYYDELKRDPRVMNCLHISKSDYVGEITPLCRKGRCGAWQHQKCLDPPACDLMYQETCNYEERIYTDETSENFGVSRQELFALDIDMCEEKCKKFYVKRLKHLKNIDVPRVAMECTFNDIIAVTGDKTFETPPTQGDPQQLNK